VKWTPRRESEGDSRMTSSPPQGLAPVTTVHEETRAASREVDIVEVERGSGRRLAAKETD